MTSISYMVFPKTYKRTSTRADARHIDYEYERIPNYFRSIYSPLFRRIIVRPEILQQVNTWSSVNLDENTIGVQVRTWRDDPRRSQKYHNPSMKRLAWLMHNTSIDERFFVVSDSEEAIAFLKEQYGKHRILHYPRNTRHSESWQSSEGLVEDLVDMLLLSRTNRLFASYLSTFSEVAWWLGGAQARVWVF